MDGMRPSRVAAWIVGVGLLGAWLASAAGISRAPRAIRAPGRAPEAVAFDSLAADVQAQTGRLRARMASAPAPEAAVRNPFTLSEPPRRIRQTQAPEPIVLQTVVAPAAELEPVLALIGVAEDTGPKGLLRTAMISGPQNDLMMVTAGQQILGMYEVVAVGTDVVELKHLTSGAVRRLALR
jgi:hypothetical protein